MRALAKKLMSYSLAVILAAAFSVEGIAASSGQGKQLLDNLVAQAKKEGTLNANLRPGLGPVSSDLAGAFKKRFGLSITVKLDALTLESQLFPKHMTALKAGAPPMLDALEGPETYNLDMIEGGFATRIENWELLLAAINPLVASGKVKTNEVSPEPFSGYSFLWSNVSKSLLYNPKLISKAELPRTRADLADSKYKGKLTVAPWAEEWLFGIRIYPKDQWLKIVDNVGKNSIGVQTYAASLDRLLLGELALSPTNSYYYWQAKDKDPRAPVGIHWFADYTAVGSVFTMIPRGARHPAAATLFALWMTTPEAEEVWQRAVPYPNLVFGQSEKSRREATGIKESKSRVVTWYDSPEAIKLHKWFSSKEGQTYRNALLQALTQRK